MIKLIAADIDGTLIPLGKRMSERTRRAIINCVNRGVIFVPASGRTFEGAIRPFKDMGIDCPVISANGGRVDAHMYESPVFEDTIDEATATRVCERLIKAGCFMTSYVGTKVYTLPETNGFGSSCASVSEASGTSGFDIEAEMQTMRTLGTQRPYKFEAYSDDTALLDKLRSEFSAEGLGVAGAFSFNVEIMAHGAGKGRALGKLMELMHISKEEVLALGDGANDLSLLNAAGVSVAMENGAESLKSAANIIAPDASLDGAAQIIEKYVLSESNR